MDKGRSIRFVCSAILAAVSLSGCYEPEPNPRIIGEDRPVIMPAVETIPRFTVLGHSVQGRPIVAQVLGDGPDTTLFIATIHGSEPAGTPLMGAMAGRLGDQPELLQGRRVVIIPVANPDGMAMRTRENIRGVDLNRNFEASNRINNATNGHGALSEPETKAIHAAIDEFKPDRIVTLHQRSRHDLPSCIDYDGPAKALAARMATYCRLPVKRLGAKPGSLGSYTGEELGIPTITMEFPTAASQLAQQALWDQYGQSVLSAITYDQQASK